MTCRTCFSGLKTCGAATSAPLSGGAELGKEVA